MASINLAGSGASAFLNRAASKANSFGAKGASALRYKKLLLVCKDSKLTRFRKKGIDMSPYVEKHYKASM